LPTLGGFRRKTVRMMLKKAQKPKLIKVRPPQRRVTGLRPMMNDFAKVWP